ncbi:MAG: Gfo/Idh/MocA family oxidoreductase [Clostridia bacterium]|nr:Gfo/Idh/MocA family oxidoreductase [Clostridia bacterium]
MIKVAVLGLGSRGKNYGGHLAKISGVTIVSICDKYQEKIDKVKDAWRVGDDVCFTDEDKFFAQGKVADLMVIATQDRDHYRHAIKALQLGYNLLLEKPVSPNIEECLEIEQLAREKGLYVLVCHVLRYAHYYKKIKEIIDSGALGDIKLIKHDENIAYWHFAHSYVRGNWRREDETSPMLLAKCCHDADLLYWFAGSKAKQVSSTGGLTYFNLDNAPEGAGDNCFECPHNKSCIFDCAYHYVGRKRGLIYGKNKFKWGTYAFSTSSRKKDIISALKSGERGKLWSRCVFKCDNDVADNQSVQIDMLNGVKIVMTVSAFNENDYRHTEIKGTKGELIADDRGSVIKLKLFDKKDKKIIVNLIPVIRGHYGGDEGIVKAVLSLLKGEKEGQYTFIGDTIESHRIVAAAELSRKNGGRLVDMSEIPDVRI